MQKNKMQRIFRPFKKKVAWEETLMAKMNTQLISITKKQP